MGIEGYYEDYFDDRQEKEKLTNFQKIKSLSLDEMAEFIDEASNSGEYTCSYCKIYEDWLKVDTDEDITGYCKYNCINGIKQWLQEESEN